MDHYNSLVLELLRKLCVIPAPSNQEKQRAEWCLNTLRSFGMHQAYMDDAWNVIREFPCPHAFESILFAAHTDVVFPDTDPLPFHEDEERIYCPGCGDDSGPVAQLMTVLKRLHDQNRKPNCHIIIALNSGEEGLGNLKGTRALMDRFGDKLTAFYTFDGHETGVIDTSVGSHRYRVTVKTKGGHSYGNFGNENAARVLAEGIQQIYAIPLPPYEGKTTYNVGMISGGTSINSIVQEASMLCEYRSENADSLAYMKEQFERIFLQMRQYADVEVELVGERPCMKDVDPEAQARLTQKCIAVQSRIINQEVRTGSGSTDCNIPHSLGIPAVCAGSYAGGGTHTREEWIDKQSVVRGLEIVWQLVNQYFSESDDC